jgi:hypothetical protein
VALLTFPSPAVNGQLYPVAPVAGQNQYQYEAATLTWRLLGAATGVVPGTYGSVSAIPQFTVDTTGRITVAADINISSVYVKTGNAGAYNSYVWPNLDGTTSQILTTDGAGNLSWTSFPYVNYWQQVGNIISPILAGASLELKDAALALTFLSNPATSTTSFFNGTTSVNIKADSLAASTISTAGTGSIAKPLYFEGSDFKFSAYSGTYLNPPSTLTITQSVITSSVGISTSSAFTANAGTANSVSSPPTRGTAGQILISNGNGTSSWVTNPDPSYWDRTATTIYPRYAGDNVYVLSNTTAPVIELNSDGTASFIGGTKSLFINPGFAASTVQLSANITTNPASMTIDANKLDLLAYGSSFSNAPTKFQLNETTGIKFNADFSGLRRNLFTVDLNGDLQAGYNVDFGSPALGVDGLTGNCVTGGTLTVNNGIAVAPGPNSYTFPNNRGVNNYVLVTDGVGLTSWKSPSALAGYWTQSGSTLDLYPTQAGQNIIIRDASSVNKVEIFSTGNITAYGGNVSNPTYAITNNGTGVYGDNLHLKFAVNALEIGEFNLTEFYSANNIRITGAATNSATNATIENDNNNFSFIASTNVLNLKGFVFQMAPAVTAGFFNNTGDFAVVQGNASIGSSNIVTYGDSINLTIGNNLASEAGLLKFVSTFNGGDGVELTQDGATGDFEIHMNHAAAPVVTVNATDTTLTTNLIVGGDTTLNGELFVPSPTVPPASASPGTVGQISWNANYIFVCVAPNLWKRTPISAW